MSNESNIVLDPNEREAVDGEGRRIFAADGTDLSLLREFRRLTPAERLRHLQSMSNLIARARAQQTTDD